MVGRLRTIYASYHPAVWWMLGATVVTAVTQFMVFPFMALYMSYHTHATPGVIGLAVGMSALTSTAFGFVGGSLADKFGRKGIMVVSMALSAVLMAVFPSIHAISMFFLLSALNGVVRTMFQPASRAMMADLTPPSRLATVFAMNYWAINVGAAIGPILGAYFGTVATGVTFYVTAIVDMFYAIVIFLVFPESKPVVSEIHPALPKFSFRRALRVVATDKAFLVFLLAGMLGGVGYAQIETTLPQVMAQSMSAAQASKLFSLVLASNAIEVVLLQVFLAKLSSRLGIVRAMMLGQILFTLGYMGISVSHVLGTYLLSMFVLTLGEIINFPVLSQYTTLLADEDLRGTYFGASSVSGLSFFLGPWLGGVILHASTGLVLFLSAAGMSLLATPLYGLAERIRMSRPVRLNTSVSQSASD